MQIELIGVPLYYGCDNPGTELAYSCFMTAGLKRCITEAGGKIAGEGEITVPPLTKKQADPKLCYLNETIESCHHLAEAVEACLRRGNFPFILGGDHSLGIGSIAGLHCFAPQEALTVIWVDAHTDINTSESSASHHIHGMPLAACLGLGDRRLFEGFSCEAPFLLPENLFYIGSRSIDPGEREILEKYKIKIFDMTQIKTLGMAETVRQLLGLVQTKRIHVSFDVDFIDSGEYTATGLPIANGPSFAETGECLRRLLADQRVGSLDFVEYSPVHDQKGEGLSLCMALCKDCVSALANRKENGDEAH